MVAATTPKVTITMYNDLPAGQLGLSQMWSGDVVNAAELPAEGHRPGDPALLVPGRRQGPGRQRPDGRPQGRQEPGAGAPVPQPHARTRRSPSGTSPRSATSRRRSRSTPTRWSPTGFVPANLTSAIVKPEYFDTGYRLLELDAANDAAWHNVWRAFKAGGPDLGDGHGPDPGPVAEPGALPPPRRERTSALWPLLAAPGIVWLLLFFLAPLYVVLAIVFGQVDPIFRTPVPVWNPLQWNPAQFNYVFTHIVGPRRRLRAGAAAHRRLRADRPACCAC